jgi:peptidoglycan-N-acetylglucosamine deacetylase
MVAIRYYKTPQIFRKLFRKALWGFSVSNDVYLTFDDGPDPEITPWVLDELQKNNIKATFFCVGQNVLLYPELFKRIIKEGHSVGNHTMQHEKGWKLSRNEYINSIEKANELIKSNLFRPPYGKMSYQQYLEVSKKYKIIMWSWLSYDFDKKLNFEKILSNARNKIKGGDIIVLHDNKKTKDRLHLILPELITICQEKKLLFNILK